VTRRYLALGDSYTIGEGVGASERWPIRLATEMRQAGVPMADPTIVATTGWTTAELLAALDAMSPPPDASHDLVSLLIGVNDQYRSLGIAAFRAGFLELLTMAVHFAGREARRVVVVSIPDWSVTPFAATDPRGRAAIAAEIDAFNEVKRWESRQAGAAFADITALSRQAAADRALLASDGLHPAAEMYRKWSAVILPVALRAIA
jgi:lysophospholipase L1-like esterase